jgi:hypothetical protein
VGEAWKLLFSLKFLQPRVRVCGEVEELILPGFLLSLPSVCSFSQDLFLFSMKEGW